MPILAAALFCRQLVLPAVGLRLDSIVFSAQLHRLRHEKTEMGEKVEISVPVAATHLYEIQPGLRINQLTRGSADDYAPRYSKTLGGVLFIRSRAKSHRNELMLLPISTLKPKRLVALPSGEFPVAETSMSGDTYVIHFNRYDWDGEPTRVVCVYRCKVLKMFGQAKFAQIIPGTETVYVQSAKYGNFTFDCRSGKRTQSWPTQDWLVWLNPQRAMSGTESAKEDYPAFALYDKLGSTEKTVKPNWEQEKWLESFLPLPQADLRSEDAVIVQYQHHMSSGHWPSCLRLNLETGKIKSLFTGQWLDTNDKGEFLALQYDWIGAYHRGNSRTAMLYRFSATGGNEKQLTNFPYDVYSAC